MWASALGSAADAEPEPTAPIQDDVVLPIQKLDDEITSVVASGSSMSLHATTRDVSAHEQTEDIVVGEASLVPEFRDQLAPRQRQETLDDGVNAAAHEDQAIRLEIMARGGSQDALQQARERLRKRRTVTLKLPPNPAAVLSDNGTIAAKPTEPDVEATDATSFEQLANRRPGDETHAPQVSPRSRGSGLPMRAYNDPMPPVPTHEIKPGHATRTKARHEQDPFDTVPAVDPEFELPLMDVATRRQELHDGDEFIDDDVFLPEEQLSSYELVLQRARAIRAATRTGHAQGQAGTAKTRPAQRRTNTPAPVPAPVKTAAPAPAMVRHQPVARNEPLVRQDLREASSPNEESRVAPPKTDRPVRRSPQAKPRSRFDVSMLISRSVSFYRQEPAAPATTESRTTSPFAEWNDEYDSIEEPVAPIQRRPAFSRSDESRSEEAIETDERFAERYFETFEGAYAELDEPEVYANDALLYPETVDDDAFDNTTQEQPGEPVPDARYDPPGDTPSDSYNAVRQREPYRSDLDADVAEAPGHTYDAQMGWEVDPSRTPRNDYRVRASYVEENVFAEESEGYDDASPGLVRSEIEEQTWQANAELEGVSPVAINEWSFEPQRNLDLRQDSGMDAFRARLFNKAPQTPRTSAFRSSQSDAIEPAAFSEDRVQRIQAKNADIPTASPKRSPLRSSSFEREEQPDRGDRTPEVQISPAREVRNEETGTVTYPLGERESAFDLRDVLDHQGDMLDMTPSLAPELPRSCRTCRDFRPAESGDRGWCNNAWAFTHSQMVDADDLACQSTIGCWWTPYDEVWLPEVRETAPTPRVAQMVTGSGVRKRSG